MSVAPHQHTAFGAPEDVLVPAGINPVFDLIANRIETGSAPGRRSDPHVLALAIEGGGMRGVVSAGMTLALECLGMSPTFDRIYGSSAGSLMGAYMISGQAAMAPSIYFQELPNRHFISRRRFLTRRPVLNLDFLIDDVIGHRMPLDYPRVLESAIELHVLATSLETGTTVDFSGFKEAEELREAMRASARLPGIAGPPVVVNGERCYDAGLTESLAYRSAIDGGATHILSLKTRATGGVPEPLSPRQKWLMQQFLRVEPEVIDLVAKRPRLYGQEDQELTRLVAHTDLNSPYVASVAPAEDDSTVGRLGRSRAELERGARVGINSVYRALGYGQPRLYEVLRPYLRPPSGD